MRRSSRAHDHHRSGNTPQPEQLATGQATTREPDTGTMRPLVTSTPTGTTQPAAGQRKRSGASSSSSKPAARSYYMQRISSGNATHVLFYVVDAHGNARLAAVGTDVKLSGHFSYASVSDIENEAPPLRATNRAAVLDWLRMALGAGTPAEDHEVILPPLAPHHVAQLHAADPMWSRPALDREYSGYREETGQFQVLIRV